MNREEYMKLLRKQLRKLPKEDFDKAIAYFEEYFEEAGAENERQAIEDLGTPQEAAGQIIRDIAIHNTKEPAGGMKKGMNAVWVGILAVFAAPVAFPVLLMSIVCLLLLVLCAVIVILCVGVAGGSVLVAGPISIIGGLSVITRDTAAGLSCLGYGFMGIGIDLLVIYGMYYLCRKLIRGLVKLFGNMVKKGGKKHE